VNFRHTRTVTWSVLVVSLSRLDKLKLIHNSKGRLGLYLRPEKACHCPHLIFGCMFNMKYDTSSTASSTVCLGGQTMILTTTYFHVCYCLLRTLEGNYTVIYPHACPRQTDGGGPRPGSDDVPNRARCTSTPRKAGADLSRARQSSDHASRARRRSNKRTKVQFIGRPPTCHPANKIIEIKPFWCRSPVPFTSRAGS